MTDGTGSGTGGQRTALVRGYLVIAGLLVTAATVNALSVLHDADRIGRSLDWWEPVVWEATSVVAGLAFAWLAWFAVLVGTSPSNGRVAAFLVHLSALFAFSLAHVATMVGLRLAIYTLAGSRYEFGNPGPEFLYEFRKDAISYLLFAGIFWVVMRLQAAGKGPVESLVRPQPTLFEIRDGARIVRVPIEEIVAVRSAGNYVEFILANGRREMMRTTLASIAEGLARYGIVRTHRYWLVNSQHIREIVSQGSGDYQLTLTGEIIVPQSRRFRNAPSLAPQDGASAA